MWMGHQSSLGKVGKIGWGGGFGRKSVLVCDFVSHDTGLASLDPDARLFSGQVS